MTSLALTIAGSDPSGGAGLQVDLKVFERHAVFGMSVVTLLTVQNTQSVSRVECMEENLVSQQYRAVVRDLPPNAIKTGALGNETIMRSVANLLDDISVPLVIDPVMISKHGHSLMDDAAVDTFASTLVPRAFLLTPNRFEAARLVGFEVVDLDSMATAAIRLAQAGAQYVLVKGGVSDRGESIDVLCDATGEKQVFTSPRFKTPHTHGSGCVFSAAITARLARGEDLIMAILGAKQMIAEAIRTAPNLGHGNGPVNLNLAQKFFDAST